MNHSIHPIAMGAKVFDKGGPGHGGEPETKTQRHGRRSEKPHLLKALKHCAFWVAMILLWSTPYGIAADRGNTVRLVTVRQFDQEIQQQEDALIVVLAAWCAPCRKELPVLVRVYNRFKQKGLKIIGMSVDYGGVDEIQPIVNRYDVPFPVYWLGEKGIARYDITAIPLLMVVENGAVSERITGVQTEKQLETLANRIIN